MSFTGRQAIPSMPPRTTGSVPPRILVIPKPKPCPHCGGLGRDKGDPFRCAGCGARLPNP